METNSQNTFDIIIIGAGAAGLTAGIYASRAKMKTLILNEGAIGGQMVLTHEIANYPGVENINGYQLARIMKTQAKTFGCKIKSNLKISDLKLDGPVKYVEVNNKDTYAAKAVIIATGGRARNLDVPGEKDFQGNGISYCATCDGDFFQDKEIIVVGGGNSAIEEAVSLTKYASKVTVVHEFDHFQAYPSAVDEARQNEKINFVMESTVSEFKGNGSLQKAVIKHIPDGTTEEMAIDGTFIFIGYEPNTEPFEGILELNARKEIVTNDLRQTSVDGVFAAGDSIAKRYRQVTTAVADGTIAALSAIDYVNKKGDE
jgi:thioredoxin reductase (NADPH)